VPKAERKKIGQFFTPISIAEYMAGLSKACNETVRVLDPGAGSGILSAAIVDGLISKRVSGINLDVYENDAEILPLLKSNLNLIRDKARERGVNLRTRVFDENFIGANQNSWAGLDIQDNYDIVIANPPYKKIRKDDMEACVMRDIVYGQPNLYFLFMAMGTHLLKKGGECIFIVPRSFSSGLYFTVFRNRFLNTVRITNLHLFASRESIGGPKDSVLQETIILRAVKKDIFSDYIEITESSDENCRILNKYSVEYDTCVKADSNAFLFFPTCEDDARVLNFVNRWPMSLPKLGYRMKTGLVVDFRETSWMRTEDDGYAIPLLWSYNFSGNRIRFPVEATGKPQYLSDSGETDRLKMKKDNYLLLKRFTSKEEAKRLQCALLHKEEFCSYRAISTENHLNFITKINGTMSEEELYGLFAILNSNYMDRYFRILNGSTQVNANEINAMPFPSYTDILQIGRTAMRIDPLNGESCDLILDNHFMRVPLDRAM
jgi:adenine-specific DNA-methyltransferase